MKILFINPVTPPNIIQVRVSLGVASLSAIAKREGHQTALLCPWEFNAEQISAKIDAFEPDLIAVSSVSAQFELAKKVIKFVYDKYRLPIIMGGIHATVAPEECIEVPHVVGVCVGEGDEAFIEFLNKYKEGEVLSMYETNNFWFKGLHGEIIRNPPRPLIQNLDSLPFPDRSIFDEYIPHENVVLEFMASRGCPFQCAYCINHVMHGIYGVKGFLRIRSVDNFLQEIKEVMQRYKDTHEGQAPGTIHFHDDTFTMNKVWMKEFCEKYGAQIGHPYACNARVETIDEETVLLLKKSGCVELKVGVESGSERIRREMLNRFMTNEQIINCFDLCNKHGLATSAFNMMGIPGETEKEIMETILLNRRIKPTVAGISIFQPYKGTKLYHVCKENNWISQRKAVSFYEGKSVIDLPTISHEKIEFYYRLFQTGVYRPWAVPFVKIAIHLKIYDPIKSTYWFIRKKAVKMLSRRQIDFIRRVLRHGK